MHKNSPIKIAGAGPSGLTAAICLAKAGLSVEVFEARQAVGERFIGDFQVIENASFTEDASDMLERMGLKKNFFFQPGHRAVFYDHRLKAQEVYSKRPFSYFIRRGPGEDTLDSGLLTQALDLGVNIHYDKRVKKEAVDIIATGPAVADGLAKEMTFKTDLSDTISVLFDMNVSPGGYSYLFVLNGRATFGCAITRDFDGIKIYFDLALARFQKIAPFSVETPQIAFSYMNFCLKGSATIQGKSVVGEAGGFQDYLFGLGIRYAMKTGYAAAQSILKGVPYDVLWKEEIGEKQDVSLVNRFLYEQGGNLGLASFVKRAGRSDLQHYLEKWHSQTFWKRLLLPWIKKSWKKESTCFHRIAEHWCREKPVSSSEISLGEVKAHTDSDNKVIKK